MSILDKFKKKFERQQKKTLPDKQREAKSKLKSEEPEQKGKATEKQSDKIEVKDKSGRAGQVILRPLQTEKITELMAVGQYSFIVANHSSKSEISKAVEAIYKVKPIKVRTINMRGKSVRFGRNWSQRKNWKKAIVTLKPGDKIEVFEGV